MASDLNFVEYICEQIGELGTVSFKKMFGEYAIYYGDKVVALVCNNQLFVKPTAIGRSTIETIVEAPPYPKAKPYFLIEDRLDDREWMSNLIQLTASELPPPKPKKPKQAKRRTSQNDR
jgi:DNA transformation protein and related proteins